MAATTPVRFRADDIWDAPDDGRRYEVIEGELYVTTAPDLDHQEPSMNLSGFIWSYLRDHPIGRIYTAPVGLILDEQNGIQPDLVYVSNAKRAILTRRGIRGTPDLVVEILSPGTEGKDRGIKMRRYAAAGVAYYWIVDPQTRTLEEYALRPAGYELVRHWAPTETFRPTIFPGLEIPMAQVWTL